MRLSSYFLPTLKNSPREADTISHRLMLRAGMIQQSSTGIYSWLPLGFKVLKRIEQIIREEQNAAGWNEMLMPTIQPAELWYKNNCYNDYGPEMLRITDRHKHNMLYGPTNEWQITDIFKKHIHSYKKLPSRLYHIQWKFRDEVRPRFGVMRGREFLMKDAYSFDIDRETAKINYNRQFMAYLRTFNRLGLKALPVNADSGLIGGKMNHEFVILADKGESEVFCQKDWLNADVNIDKFDYNENLQPVVDSYLKRYSATKARHDPVNCPIELGNLINLPCIEVGHIFYLGNKYSEPMGARVTCPNGRKKVVHMGSYGIGISRLVGAIVEAYNDKNGIVWPEKIAPFHLGLINLSVDDMTCRTASEDIYTKLCSAGVDILMDDSYYRPGVKLAIMDLIGLPWQIVVSPRHAVNKIVEIKNRRTGKREEISVEEVLTRFAPANQALT
ncbi:prolyl-tRNA synthetase [Candidatus Endolissoclinum faulkneri L5]|uniref:Proline--tRNA ligase n=1 Tax=Candidatus Endolissoclinum faulkneri L5 TaxID=1401328 RepID=V9TT38_9PROT|nr:proline--tRNA ligase [Candidatus Endolissoclinum faulkneri]AHC73741.1 prolyl-tRNA synthetase [Candidatus Endolissoclinum faulkneri L5]